MNANYQTCGDCGLKRNLEESIVCTNCKEEKIKLPTKVKCMCGYYGYLFKSKCRGCGLWIKK